MLALGGNITSDDFTLDEHRPLAQCLDELKEDMLQVEYPDGHLLDVGWRPSFDPNGRFHIVQVKDHDWERPAYQGTAKNLDTLKVATSRALRSLR